MPIRAQQPLGDVLLPPPWRELEHTAGRVLAHALQDVDEVRARLDAV